MRRNTTDELDRLGAWARSTTGARPRLDVAEIAQRGRRRRRRRRLVLTGVTTSAVVLGLFAGILAFGPTPGTTTVGQDVERPERSGPEPSTAEPAAPLVLTVLRPLRANDPWPSALLTGRLAFEDGCVFLYPENHPERMLVIWRWGHTLDTRGPAPVVLSPDGTPVGTNGDTVRLVGGGVGDRVLQELSIVDLRRSCVTTQVAFVHGAA